MSLDAIPPHDALAEQSLLGSLLIDRDAIIRVAPVIEEADFFDPRHRTLYRAVLGLYHKRIPADFVTIMSFLDARRREGRDPVAEVGGLEYLAALVAGVPTAVHANYYATRVRDLGVKRRLGEVGADILRAVYDPTLSTVQVIERAGAALATASQVRGTQGPLTARDILSGIFDRLGEAPPPAVDTGFADLDRLLEGMLPGQLVVPAGRPSMGKTALAVCLAHFNAVRRGVPVGFISMEMTAEALMRRFLAIETGLTSHQIRQSHRLGDGDLAALTAAMGHVSEAPLYLDDSGDRALSSVLARARNLQAQFGLKLLVIDYLQLIQDVGGHKGDNRTAEVGRISGALKQLAMELRIPVIAPAQLNRMVETRADKMPTLADLRESGAIEQDADIVLMIHRPEYYEPGDRPGLAQLSVAKNRDGETDVIELGWQARVARFVSRAAA